jgi:hypothetical protein
LARGEPQPPTTKSIPDTTNEIQNIDMRHIGSSPQKNGYA